MSDDINRYLPSILDPRSVNKQNLSLTQNSVISRRSLSLKRSSTRNINRNAPTQKQLLIQNHNLSCIQSTSGPKKKLSYDQMQHLSDFEEFNKENNANDLNASILTAKRPAFLTNNDFADASTIHITSLEDLGSETVTHCDLWNQFSTGVYSKTTEHESLDLSVFEDRPKKINTIDANDVQIVSVESKYVNDASSADQLNETDKTLAYDLKEESHVSISFGVTDCERVDITAKNSSIKKVSVSRKDKDINLECEVAECLTLSTESDVDENMNVTSPKCNKRAGVAVNLEIKKKKPSNGNAKENSKVLILKTDAINKLSHVIVQPPNYKLVKRHILDNSKFQSGSKRTVGRAKNGKGESASDKLRQIPIDSFFARESRGGRSGAGDVAGGSVVSVSDEGSEMSRNLGVSDAVNCELLGRSVRRTEWKGHEASPRSARVLVGRSDTASPKRQEVKGSSSEAPRSPSLRPRNESASSHSPRKTSESIHFNVTTKTKSSRAPSSARNIPHYKIVAGTHFAVDAFSYGEIPNVRHYFLTHFHSDHYAGLKKSFNKLLYCSKITGDLCVSRLGVNPKCIHVLNLDTAVRIEGVEVTAVDANHCPGAVMLVFCLPNGKTILHTGDFRASPAMESYPLFWNKDIHTIYLDTTYCNSRYDFPTQDQSLEMALSLLRQKKMALEKSSKKFSSVLIVCGTYTIGKEKFFLGMARRVGCAVWACPEKDRVLQAVEGRSFSHAHPHSCQLHVVPMRDLTHEKLKSYLDSLHGAFSEVVAFKPSGWENGKNSTIEKDNVTIHGIPYSEHSSFSELIRFVKFLKPKQVVPTVDISGGIKAVQNYFPCPLVYKEDTINQSKVTDYFSIQGRPQASAVT